MFDTLPAGNLKGPVTIHWNDYQVPFIEAEHDEDAAFALGLVHAHLRLGSMEIAKRIAAGRISEMVGPVATDIDAALRAVGINRTTHAVLDAMPADSLAWLDAYVRGVNHYKSHMPEPPHEFAILNMEDEVWRKEDSIALGRLGGVDVNWLIMFNLLPYHRDTDDWPDIWRRIAETQGATVPGIDGPPQTALKTGRTNALRRLARFLAPFVRSGSNSFALSGARTVSGAPIIGNDPHLGFFIPNFWLIAGLKAPGYHVVGMMPTGIPVFAFGRNRDLAWGGTNMRQEASDFVDVTGMPGLTEESHTIKRRFFWDTRSENRMSAYGPVVSDAEALPFPEGRDIALRWAGHLPSDEITALLGVAKTRGWQDMHRAIEGFSMPGQNFIFANTAGNIGHLLATWIPRRTAPFPDDLWVTPRESDAAWRNLLTAKHLPFSLNPDGATVASANDRPFPDTDLRIG